MENFNAEFVYKITAAYCAVKGFDKWTAEDLQQSVALAVIKATLRHDPSRASLKTFLYHRIRGAIKDFVRDLYSERAGLTGGRGKDLQITCIDDTEPSRNHDDVTDMARYLSNELDSEHVELLTLYIGGETIKRISDITGLSGRVVYLKLQYIKNKMRDFINYPASYC